MKCFQGLRDGPPGLSRFHTDPTTVKDWDGFGTFEKGDARRELTDALVDRQHGVCAYCEATLVANDKRVEHFVPQSDPIHGTNLSCNLRNLMAVCKGGSEAIFGPDTLTPDPARYLPPVRKNLSCDAAKGNRPALDFLDPRTVPGAPSLFRVSPDGKIGIDLTACATNTVAEADVAAHITGLRLNVERLRMQREAVWSELTNFYLGLAGESEDMKSRLLNAFAERRLLPGADGRMDGFFSTTRSFFGPVAESVLQQPPQSWI